MPFAVFVSGSHKAGADEVRAYYELYLEYLKPLMEVGRIAMEGLFSQDNGSLTIMEADSMEEVLRILERDPYISHNASSEVQIKYFDRIYPDDNGQSRFARRREGSP